MRHVVIVLWVLFWSVPSAIAQVSVGVELPGVSIGINVPLYPELAPVPAYPVYYAPRLSLNYFFYDGMYWVYQGDNWYVSSWYNGPWGLVAPDVVPLYVLRVPVRYYRQPPGYFRGWPSNAPPRWGEHLGNEWEQRRRGWDRWNRSSAPPRAPLPVYQRRYSGDRYPQVEQQQALHSRNYRYNPRDAVVRQYYQGQGVQRAPTPSPSQRGQQGAPQERAPKQQDVQHSKPPPSVHRNAPTAPHSLPPQKGGEHVQGSRPTKAHPRETGGAIQDQGQRRQPQPHPPQGAVEQQTPRSSQRNIPQGKGASQEPRREQGQENGREKDEEGGQERNSK
jgi:hypothetical protein